MLSWNQNPISTSLWPIHTPEDLRLLLWGVVVPCLWAGSKPGWWEVNLLPSFFPTFQAQREQYHIWKLKLLRQVLLFGTQVRILEWVAFPFSMESSQPRDQTQVSHTAGGFFTNWAIGEDILSEVTEISVTSDIQMTPSVWQKVKRNSRHHLYGRKWRGTQEPLDESERGEWKSWLKTQHSKNKDHGIQSHHFMANRWGNNGTCERLYFLGLQDHCRGWLKHEIKRPLLLGRETITNLESILKSRDITLSTKVCVAKAMVFPIVMYGCESWTIKKAENK